MAKTLSSSDYVVIVEKIDNPFVRNLKKAAKDLADQVNAQAALGWEPQGGVAIGAAGTAPYLVQAMVKRR